MRLTDYQHIQVDTAYLKPTLRFQLEIEYKPIYAPLSFFAQLELNGKIISEFNSNTFRDIFNIMPALNKKIDEIKDKTFYINFYFPLDKQSINAIEEQRLNTQDKSVQFNIELSINTISQFENLNVNNEKLSKRLNKIEQSVWVSKFTQLLGIGDFHLLEFIKPSYDVRFSQALEKLPEDSQLRKALAERFSQFFDILETMKERIRNNKWQEAIEGTRPLVELFRFGKEGSIRQEELKQLYINRNGTDTGFDDFSVSIERSFKYISKYIHALDANGNVQVRPIAQEEDAQFAYSICFSIINMIIKKTINQPV